MQYLQTNTTVAELARKLERVILLAADTEAAGYHRYSDRVCLLQISTRDETFVIDTLAATELAPLQPVFARHDAQIVFHDADYDLRLLHRDFGIEVARLFDTKVAAQFIGLRSFGLGSLTEQLLGIPLEKKHQRADWAQRPLPPELLAYAAEDTRHLPALRDRLVESLVKLGRLKWAEEEFRIVQESRWARSDESGAYLRLKGARELRPRQLAALRELHAWREATGEQRDVATFRVLSNEALVALARRLPTKVDDLRDIPGLSAALIERRGAELLVAIQRAQRVAESQLPFFPRGARRPPTDAEFDARLERLKNARDRRADDLDLERGFLMPRYQLEEIARHKPRSLPDLSAIVGVRAWQVEALGEALLGAI